jgi:predicted nucleic acid-binding Zn ribbon protein
MSSNKQAKQTKPDFDVNIAKRVCIQLLGVELGNAILPQFVKNRTLTVNCLSSASAEAIRERQQEIVDKINEKIGKKDIDRIRYLL